MSNSSPTTKVSLPNHYQPFDVLPAAVFASDFLTFEIALNKDTETLFSFDSDRDLAKYQCLRSDMSLDEYTANITSWLDSGFAGRCPQAPIFTWLLKGSPELLAKLAARGFSGEHLGYVQLSVVDSTTVQLGAVIAKNA
jgi:hypothetical protein